MCCWRPMEQRIQQLSTIKPSQQFQAGPCSAWLGWMELFEMLQLLGIPLCCTAPHPVSLQQAEGNVIRSCLVTASLCKTNGMRCVEAMMSPDCTRCCCVDSEDAMSRHCLLSAVKRAVASRLLRCCCALPKLTSGILVAQQISAECGIARM